MSIQKNNKENERKMANEVKKRENKAVINQLNCRE